MYRSVLTLFVLLLSIFVALGLSIGTKTTQAQQLPAASADDSIIDKDTVWTAANSPYTLITTLQIAPNVTLTIEPGVTVIGLGPHQLGFQVYGTLEAVGTHEHPVVFHDVGIAPSFSPTAKQPSLIRIKNSILRGGGRLHASASARCCLVLQDSYLEEVWTPISIWEPSMDLVIERNVFVRSGGIGRIATSPVSGSITVRNNVFFGQREPLQIVTSLHEERAPITIVHNSFLEPESHAVTLSSHDGTQNYANNYWGTTDPDVIADMIWDAHDSFGYPEDAIVIFEPFLTAPHPDTPNINTYLDFNIYLPISIR